MRLVIAAVGRLKDGPERELYNRYAGRIGATGKAVGLGPLDLVEVVEGRAIGREARIADEAQRLIAKCPAPSTRIVLDERGKSLTSKQFADLLRSFRERGAATTALLIGGPDGHGTAILDTTDVKLCLSAMTLTHGLARVMLAEQIYRATTILTGHPYHRE